MKKLSAGMVKYFLDTDSNLRKAHISPFDTETPNFEGDIYQGIQILLWFKKALDPSGLSSSDSNETASSLDYEDEEISKGVVALHLAMIHGSIDVISLFLLKELEKGKLRYQSMLHKIDSEGRTPLHIACQHNVDLQII